MLKPISLTVLLATVYGCATPVEVPIAPGTELYYQAYGPICKLKSNFSLFCDDGEKRSLTIVVDPNVDSKSGIKLNENFVRNKLLAFNPDTDFAFDREAKMYKLSLFDKYEPKLFENPKKVAGADRTTFYKMGNEVEVRGSNVYSDDKLMKKYSPVYIDSKLAWKHNVIEISFKLSK